MTLSVRLCSGCAPSSMACLKMVVLGCVSVRDRRCKRETHLVADAGRTEHDTSERPGAHIREALGSVVLRVKARVAAGVVGDALWRRCKGRTKLDVGDLGRVSVRYVRNIAARTFADLFLLRIAAGRGRRA